VAGPDGEVQSPMTLAIIDTYAFATFVTAMDALASELYDLIGPDNDRRLLILLSRAQFQAVRFAGSEFDDHRAVVDLGHFLALFDGTCSASGALGDKITVARNAYTDMMIAQGVGPGTNPDASGLGIFWPNRRSQRDNPGEYLDDEYLHATSGLIDPWNDFMERYYAATPVSQEADACNAITAPTVDPRTEDDSGNTLTDEQQADILLLNPAPTIDENDGSVTMTSEVSETCVSVTTYYGMWCSHVIMLRHYSHTSVGNAGFVAAAASTVTVLCCVVLCCVVLCCVVLCCVVLCCVVR
jgi:hypothetical protein